ncbi:MAG: large-conductance mechanosensitive channel protein MscL [Verrucomicrobiota bacterium]
MAMLKEFRDFILKGNMLDMAVGIIIGAAFGTVIKSLVSNVIMPPIGLILGGIDFSELSIKLQDAKPAGEDGTAAVEAVAINYGTFINDVISLVIIGFCIFMMVKFYNEAKSKFEKKEEPEPEKDPEPSKEEVLLTEIRDLLAKKS